jgi:hypothetical protein
MSESRFPGLNDADARLAQSVFDFVQFLLDDDENLTPAGNLTGAARQKLRGRLNELVAAETVPVGSTDTAVEEADSDPPPSEPAQSS